ncbi:MAG: hypothetical protein PHC34_11260, partial [Candidatus Gastranaerophilales bacterium]|nr:hypothetical protein [Candidatus Gastranaerophilales bacterium]
GQDAVVYRTIEELTYAIAYMTLEVHKQGLGASIVGAMGNELTGSVPEIYAEVRKRLNLPENLILVTLLAIGYPASGIKKPLKSRKSSEEIISYEKYGNR